LPRIFMERSGEMEVFARVVQQGGVSAAAHSLGLTPLAVNKVVARLESRLGVRLLVRTAHNINLTREGEAYFRAALPILEALSEAERAASAGAVSEPQDGPASSDG
jgi:DNA-binding transcriptional LysR family regulator